MKPWDDETTIKKLRKISGSRKVLMGIELTEFCLANLKKALIRSRIKKTNLEKELRKIIWQKRV